MKNLNIVFYTILSFILFCLSSCIFDGGRANKIVDNYSLHRWEDGYTFYIVSNKWGEPDDGWGLGGLIKGTVQKIGWNEDYIFVERKAHFGGDPDGWMIIDVNTNKITGPFTDEEFKDKQQKLIEDKTVKIYDPAEAWKVLD